MGAWPFEPDAEPSFKDRVRGYLTKAIREAKVNTSWLSPDEEYEIGGPPLRGYDPRSAAAVPQGVPAVSGPRRGARHVQQLVSAVDEATAPEFPTSTRAASSGIFSFVDPDNRRPVDYARRNELLDALPSAGAGNDRAPAGDDPRNW